jgi:hypothetical protein
MAPDPFRADLFENDAGTAGRHYALNEREHTIERSETMDASNWTLATGQQPGRRKVY